MNSIEVMQMQVHELRELDADRLLRDEIINQAVNVLEVIERGRGACGEKIDRKRYAKTAREIIERRWNECLPIELPRGEIVNPHVRPHVPEPQPDFDAMNDTLVGPSGGPYVRSSQKQP